MTNIIYLNTQSNKKNITDNQSELFPTEKQNTQHEHEDYTNELSLEDHLKVLYKSQCLQKNARHEEHTYEQQLYVEENFEKALTICQTHTLDKYPSGDSYNYSLILLPNEDVALIKLTHEQDAYNECDWHTYCELISYVTQFSSQNLAAILQTLLKHEHKVISNDYNNMMQREEGMAHMVKTCMEDEIDELKAQVHKFQNHWLYSKLKFIFGAI